MSHHLTIPFQAFRLKFHSGIDFLSPLQDNELFHIDPNLEVLGGQYAHLFEKHVLHKGKLHSLLNEVNITDFEKWTLTIPFSAAKDGVSYPEFSLDFDYFAQKKGSGFWGLIPSLGVESFGNSQEELIDQLSEVVRMEFSRAKRLAKVRRIVSAIWWDTVSLEETHHDLFIPTPNELENQTNSEGELLLTKVAYRLTVTEQTVFEREKEMKILLDSFQSNFQQNILLVGPSGVGKTAMVKELAYRTETNDNSIWLTTASTLIKEFAGDDVGWETNMTTFCGELAQTNDYLFITNLKELFEVGQYMGNVVSMAEFLIPFLKKGNIKIISECTEEELAKIDLRSPLYLSHFQIIKVQTPTKGLEKMIQQKFKTGYNSENESVRLANTAITEIMRLNQRFSPYSGLPGKPIRFLETVLMNRKNTDSDKTLVINRKEVIQQFSEESGLPLFMIDPEIPMDVPSIKTKFNNNVYGQEAAVDIVVDKLASVKTALTRTGKPISSFLFVGPTGVGKTELAKVLSEFMFGHRNKMIRFDMSEYSSPYAVGRLIGEPGGGEGRLTSAVRQNPFCVLLFDEIEKAHPSVYDLFLQILGDGRLTDQLGKVVNFCSSIIILTSNIGAGGMQGNRISWNPSVDAKEVMQLFDTAVQKYFRPELYNRIDQVIPFAPLDKDTMRFVVDREIKLLKKLEGIRYKNMNFKIDSSVLDHFAQTGFHPKYGARYLQRTIRDKLTAPLAATLNSFDQEERLNVEIKMENDVLKITTEADPLGVDLYWEVLEQITNADYTSEIRRKVIAMQEGNSYIQLLNQLDIYEEQRKRLKEEFFNDVEKAKNYSLLLATKEKVEAFTKKVVDLEQRFDLTVLDRIPYESKMEEELDSCKDELFAIKLEIYARLHPQVNKCQLGVFGTDPALMFKPYASIFESKNFEYKVFSAWHRDSWYNEVIEVKNEKTGKVISQKRETYMLREEHAALNHKIIPDRPDDVLVGLTVEIEGPCASLFLKVDHNIFVSWKLAEKKTNFYLIQVAKELAPPENIHRLAFFNNALPSRFIKEGHIKDIKLNLNREIRKGEHADWLLRGMDDAFKRAVENIV